MILILVGASAHLSKLADELLEQYNSVFPSVPDPQQPDAMDPFEPAVRRLTAEENAELVAAYLAGETITSITKRLGLHRGTLYHRLHRAGIELRQREALDLVQVRHASRLYQDGDSLATVGRVFGVDAQTIRNHLAKAGVEIRKRRGWA